MSSALLSVCYAITSVAFLPDPRAVPADFRVVRLSHDWRCSLAASEVPFFHVSRRESGLQNLLATEEWGRSPAFVHAGNRPRATCTPLVRRKGSLTYRHTIHTLDLIPDL